ncbi:hypothetical protein [Paraburkholderia terrae]|uniref:hypothetical protein n=1 Tax=Paraburkholderia terrae TaxID=311230 RepID=UPI0033654155
MTDDEKRRIQQVHILLSMYNALQPGVFAVSGWDLVGALPLPIASVEDRMSDGDTRWIQRGAYDLTGSTPEAMFSAEGIPRARCLYGSLPDQLSDPQSFASQLKQILAVRQAYGIASSRQVAIPDVSSPGLLVMVHDLPAGKGTQITALNFGATSVEETITLSAIATGPVVDMIAESVEGDLNEDGHLMINLGGYEGVCLRIVSALPIGIEEVS